MQYLVTTDKNQIPQNSHIVMVDGTVPGWERRAGDLHFDHHKPGGALVQIDEIEPSNEDLVLESESIFVTTQVDADACVAAAYVQLLHKNKWQEIPSETKRKLRAIAMDCDHLGVTPDLANLAEFARNAVAALKLNGDDVRKALQLPENRKEWTEAGKTTYASECFRYGTSWLYEAAQGWRSWPGEFGEAAEYWAKVESQRQTVYENCWLYRGCAIFDQRSINEYVDPRLLLEWARANGATEPITLTVRDGSRLPNAGLIKDFPAFSYTLGSIPLHSKGSPKFSDRNIWAKLTTLEMDLRGQNGLPMPETFWGGRNEVGGSSWRDPAIATPEQIIDAVLG